MLNIYDKLNNRLVRKNKYRMMKPMYEWMKRIERGGVVSTRTTIIKVDGNHYSSYIYIGDRLRTKSE